MWRFKTSVFSKQLKRLVSPIVESNSTLYKWFNKRSGKLLSQHGERVPLYLTANAITTARTSLIVPTLFLYSNGFAALPASLVVVNVTFDYVDGAVARWEKSDPKRVKALESSGMLDNAVRSCRKHRLNTTFGAYYDAIADKAFAIPLWMCIFQSSFDNPILQTALLGHSAIEIYSSYIRTKAYFDEPSPLHNISLVERTGTPSKTKVEEPPQHSGSAVVAGYVGKTKQFLAMLGTALVMVPVTSPVGTMLLLTSLPLAYLSVYQKAQQKNVYCEIDIATSSIVPQLNYIEHSRSLGSSLIVGLKDSSEDQQNKSKRLAEMTKILQLNHAVDFILVPESTPSQIDQTFLNTYNINLVTIPENTSLEDQVKKIHRSLFEKGMVIPVPDGS